MSEYNNLKPIFASSVMKISRNNLQLIFSNTISYDYLDLEKDTTWKSYMEFLKNPSNYKSEIELYWENFQTILDGEINKINGEEVYLKVVHCSIKFRDETHPFVQWIIEFDGKYVSGQNVYENYLEEDEILEYPIHSIYIFQEPLTVKEIKSSLKYKIENSNRIVEYFGETNDKLENYEAIIFQ